MWTVPEPALIIGPDGVLHLPTMLSAVKADDATGELMCVVCATVCLTPCHMCPKCREWMHPTCTHFHDVDDCTAVEGPFMWRDFHLLGSGEDMPKMDLQDANAAYTS